MNTSTRVLAAACVPVAVTIAGLAVPASASTSTTSTSTHTSSTSRADDVIHWAKKLKGKPYRYGGDGPKAFDCSGYVQYVYGKAGKHLGRTSGAQLAGKHISKSDKRPGDVLIFLRGGYAYHSAIYAGHGKMYEAQRSGVPVGKHKIWSSGYVVRRPGGGAKATTTSAAFVTQG